MKIMFRILFSGHMQSIFRSPEGILMTTPKATPVPIRPVTRAVLLHKALGFGRTLVCHFRKLVPLCAMQKGVG